MLIKKTTPVSVKYSLTVPQSVRDRIDRVHAVAESAGYTLEVEKTLIRSIAIGLARWERKLGIGSNAATKKVVMKDEGPLSD